MRWRLKSPASRLFTQLLQIKENIKAPRHWPLWGEFTGTGEFPAQRASNAEDVSIWWRHHENLIKVSDIKEEPGAYTNRNCIPKKSRTLMTMTSKFHPWFRRKSILMRHLNTLRGLRYHGLYMRVRSVTWTTLCHNNESFWLLTSTKLLMIAHILGALMGLTNFIIFISI